MIRYYWTRYLAIYPTTLLYMLQDSEYKLGQYFAWFNRTSDFRHVMKRRNLDITPKIKLLRIGLWSLWTIAELAVAVCIYIGFVNQSSLWGLIAIFIVLLMPYLMAYGIIVPLFIGRVLIQLPREKAIIKEAHEIFAAHPATRIAVVGSFGKTTAKEILATVLSEGLNVAATPGNMNTPIGISRFARKLSGKEDVLVIEFGEGKPGDVKELSQLSQPTMGIITGINESHLESFKSLESTISTIFELVDYVGKNATVYKNKENDILADLVSPKDTFGYSHTGVNGWQVSDLETDLHGTTFTIKKDKTVIHAHTKLIGLHTVGVTVAAVSIAHDLGLSVQQIEASLKKIQPFEHRMDPRQLHGAWVIDDTYNGNSDGVKAGLALLKNTKAKRRIYVTPGLVEQGNKTEQVHIKVGEQAAKSADVVVLMKNSVTDYIMNGLKNAGFKGQLIIIDDPLEFYTNLEHFVAAGDVVLMQNDWTDNYV
ncbi:UDP-N-acetylmuramoyl-tripeptide--D-alanyl-D-alanine ligase [Patescibacteria group bacterium]|nr:MAG: UDP-N-acetylmuramoyl-tripeptide--D-alanyl-D-alanine ligase [Patescibacteria group bacterium]